jgi:hypothetical protein
VLDSRSDSSRKRSPPQRSQPLSFIFFMPLASFADDAIVAPRSPATDRPYGQLRYGRSWDGLLRRSAEAGAAARALFVRVKQRFRAVSRAA